MGYNNTMTTPQQLTLNIKLRDDATFNNFYPGSNQEIIALLHDLSVGNGEQCIYIWGKSGSGRSHLLQACCHSANQQGLATIYLPLKMANELSPQILEDLEHITLICLDDIDNIIGQQQWEEAIFHIFNKLRDNQGYLLVSANTAPAQLEFLLPDLQSRLSWGIVSQIQSLTDEQKLEALRNRAKARGMHLSSEVGKYLLHKYSRDTNTLFNILEQLDHASLTAQHKLTIPFIKKVLF